MPKTKTIQIDEVLPADGGENMKDAAPSSDQAFSNQPFPNLKSGLGWKARITLALTQWFLILRSKSWGKWVIVPVVILFVLLVIPLALLGISALVVVSIFRSLTRKLPQGP